MVILLSIYPLMLQLPEPFIHRMQAQLGVEADAFFKSLESETPVSVRLNPYKNQGLFNDYERVPWCDHAYYLPQRIPFIQDPFFHAGCYYVQEASSMYIEQAIRLFKMDHRPIKALDLCAAPGGKSTHLLSLLSDECLLVSNEVIPNRNKILRENITKWGLSNVVVTQNDAKDFGVYESLFDLILVDAPCSGEGLFRKNHDAVQEWSPSNLTMCSVRQHQILQDVIPALKPGGMLLYSTCTYNPDENDSVVDGLILSGEFEKVQLPVVGAVASTRHGLQLMPHRIKGEGFYIAALIKTGGYEVSSTQNFKISKNKSSGFKHADEWLNIPAAFEFVSLQDHLYALPKQHLDSIQLLQSNCYIRKAGVCMGSLSGDGLMPSHELALYKGVSDQLTSIELDLDAALKYLKGEAIPTFGKKTGWHLATFKNQPLGWMKGVGSRFNNAYPKELRIRKQL